MEKRPRKPERLQGTLNLVVSTWMGSKKVSWKQESHGTESSEDFTSQKAKQLAEAQGAGKDRRQAAALHTEENQPGKVCSKQLPSDQGMGRSHKATLAGEGQHDGRAFREEEPRRPE